MAFWIEVGLAFKRAYDQKPPDESLIFRIYSYADWCANARHGPDAGHDPRTAVVVAFFEHIPTIPAAREDMPRWFTYEEVAQNRPNFSYHIGDEEYQCLLRHMRVNRHLYKPRSPQSDGV